MDLETPFGIWKQLPQISAEFWNWISGLEPKSVQAIATVGSLLLSLLLLGAYRRQTKILRAQHDPTIQANRFRVVDEQDTIEIDVSNHGQGPAIDLEARTVFSPVGSKRKTASTWSDLVPSDVVDSEWREVTDNKLGPGEEEAPFQVDLALNTSIRYLPDRLPKFSWKLIPLRLRKYLRRESGAMTFYTAMNELSQDNSEADCENTTDEENADVEFYRVRVIVGYRDALDRYDEEPVFDYVIPVVQELKFKTAIEAGGTYKEYIQNKATFRQNAKRKLLEEDLIS